MSQQKVERYKELKRNRKQIIKKEKRRKMAGRVIALLIVSAISILILLGLGNLIGSKVKEYRASLPVYTSTSFIIGDMAGVRAEETEQASEGATETPTTASDPDKT